MATHDEYNSPGDGTTWWQDAPRVGWRERYLAHQSRMRISRFGKTLEITTNGDTWDVRRHKPEGTSRVDTVKT